MEISLFFVTLHCDFDSTQFSVVETDDARTFFMIDIPCHEEFTSTPIQVFGKSDVHKDVHKEITERQSLIIHHIKKNVRIKIKDLSEILSVNERTIRRDLNILQEQGFVIRQGGRKQGQWVVKSPL
ncbi:MAG: DeoR family transcriptional regulator [Muribaculaceae bacterium]|nr:DeoR family transcriptional regulator [Muribaculaceae bacterium]